MAVTLCVALGSPLLSTASRGLWSHTGGLLPSALAVALALWLPRLPRIGTLVALGSACAWAVLCRPTHLITGFAIAAYLVRYRPRDLLVFVLSGLTWAAAFAGYFLSTRGTPAPTYFLETDLAGSRIFEALAGHLVSPSRGLIVYCPWLLLCVLVALSRRAGADERGWLPVAMLACAAHLAVISRVNAWHGGSAYGPRLWTDLLPWFAVIASVALARLGLGGSQAAGPRAPAAARWLRWALVAALAWSCAVHGVGAFSQRSWNWNGIATSRSARFERAWDWRQAQFLSPWLAIPEEVDPQEIPRSTRPSRRE